MDQELAKLNPQIIEVMIGTKTLKKIKVYPLSMGDQLKMTQLIVSTLQQLYTKKEDDNFAFAETVRATISSNLEEILKLVTDEENVISNISNLQGLEIAEHIYEMNYEAIEKKVKSLIEKVTKTFLSQNLQQQSSEDIPNTDLNTSSKEVLETEE